MFCHLSNAMFWDWCVTSVHVIIGLVQTLSFTSASNVIPVTSSRHLWAVWAGERNKKKTFQTVASTWNTLFPNLVDCRQKKWSITSRRRSRRIFTNLTGWTTRQDEQLLTRWRSARLKACVCNYLNVRIRKPQYCAMNLTKKDKS